MTSIKEIEKDAEYEFYSAARVLGPLEYPQEPGSFIQQQHGRFQERQKFRSIAKYAVSDNESKQAFKRYLLVKSILRKNKDKKGSKLLGHLIKAALDYLHIVAKKCEEKGPTKYEEAGETRKVRELVSRGVLRRHEHRKLMDSLKNLNKHLVDKYKGMIPASGIYTFKLKSRTLVGIWAEKLLKGMYNKDK